MRWDTFAEYGAFISRARQHSTACLIKGIAMTGIPLFILLWCGISVSTAALAAVGIYFGSVKFLEASHARHFR